MLTETYLKIYIGRGQPHPNDYPPQLGVENTWFTREIFLLYPIIYVVTSSCFSLILPSPQ